jgi:polysaccharide biosynthesis/export protein
MLPHRAPKMFALSLAGSVTLAFAACSSTGAYTPVGQLPPSAQSGDQDFLIRDTDTVNVRVYQQDSITTNQRVRPDGRIVVPMAGEFIARGKKPADLGREIQDKLKGVLVTPVVTVSVEQSAQISVSVVGQVKNAGAFQMDPGSSVLHALASAGGLSDYASEDLIFVLRRSLPQRIRFKFADLRNGDKSSIGFGLQAGDVVVVE